MAEVQNGIQITHHTRTADDSNCAFFLLFVWYTKIQLSIGQQYQFANDLKWKKRKKHQKSNASYDVNEAISMNSIIDENECKLKVHWAKEARPEWARRKRAKMLEKRENWREESTEGQKRARDDAKLMVRTLNGFWCMLWGRERKISNQRTNPLHKNVFSYGVIHKKVSHKTNGKKQENMKIILENNKSLKHVQQ